MEWMTSGIGDGGQRHISRVTNGPTEALNIPVKRAIFGFRNFANYRIRALPLRRKPNRDPLAKITPHWNPMSHIAECHRLGSV